MCSRNDDSTGWLHPGDPGFPYEEVRPYLPTIELRDGSEAVLLEDLEMPRTGLGTEAGLALAEAIRTGTLLGDPAGYVFAIEAEAVADYRASLAAEVRAFNDNDFGDPILGADAMQNAVLRLIEGDTHARER